MHKSFNKIVNITHLTLVCRFEVRGDEYLSATSQDSLRVSRVTWFPSCCSVMPALILQHLTAIVSLLSGLQLAILYASVLPT